MTLLGAYEPLRASRDAPPDPLRRPSTPAELHKWISDELGAHIPRNNVCPDHDAPFAFVADAFLNDISDAVVLGPRSGGKTRSLAHLHTANARWKPGHETTHYGAIMAQANRCRREYDRGIARPVFYDFSITRRGIPGGGYERTWASGSQIEILPGTEAQTQGPHPHVTTYDELEQGKRQPRENAKATVEAYTDPLSGEERVGQYIETSTRVTGLGLMQTALNEAAENKTPIYTWCVLETMRPCDGVSGPTCKGWSCPIAKWCIGDGEAAALHVCEDGGVHGRVVHADGWRSYEQIIAVFTRAGEDTWEAQHLCRKPESKALIYSPFSAANVTEFADYIPGAGPIWLSYDWGFTDNTHINLWQVRDGERPDGTRGLALYGFLELVGNQRSERDWVEDIVIAITETEGYDGPTVEEWKLIWQGRAKWPRPWPDVWPEISAGDPSAVQFRSELRAIGAGLVRDPKLTTHKVVSGQDTLRTLILAGGGRQLYLHPRCGATIHSLENYRAKMLPDGSFTEKPDPDPANHAFSHGCDGPRYMAWSERRRFGIGTGSSVDEGDAAT